MTMIVLHWYNISIFDNPPRWTDWQWLCHTEPVEVWLLRMLLCICSDGQLLVFETASGVYPHLIKFHRSELFVMLLKQVVPLELLSFFYW